MGAEHAHAFQHPVNLCLLAACAAAAGFKPSIIDYEIFPYSHKAFGDTVRAKNPSLIGYTAMTPSIDFAAEMAATAKQAAPDVINVVGGPHTSILPIETLERYPQFDVAVMGEGEKVFVDICRTAEDGMLGADALPSAVIRNEDGELVGSAGSRMTPMNLDELPFPARELLDLKKYRGVSTPGVPGGRGGATQLFTARGCPGKCIFCCSEHVFGRRVRSRSVDHVMAEVEDCIARFGFTHFTIDNDTFTYRRGDVMEFCERIAALGVTWDCDTRVDRVDEEMIHAMAQSGCLKIAFGVETGSPEILKLIKKGITIEQIKTAFAAASKAGMLTCAFLMVGNHPEETESDIEMTGKLVREIRPDLVSVAIATPYPGTQLERLMKEEGLLENSLPWHACGQSFHGKPITRTKTISPTRLLELQTRMLRSFYLDPGYILRRLARLRSPGEIRYWFGAGIEFVKYLAARKK